jgi:hypothetical protein
MSIGLVGSSLVAVLGCDVGWCLSQCSVWFLRSFWLVCAPLRANALCAAGAQRRFSDVPVARQTYKGECGG